MTISKKPRKGTKASELLRPCRIIRLECNMNQAEMGAILGKTASCVGHMEHGRRKVWPEDAEIYKKLIDDRQLDLPFSAFQIVKNEPVSN